MFSNSLWGQSSRFTIDTMTLPKLELSRSPSAFDSGPQFDMFCSRGIQIFRGRNNGTQVTGFRFPWGIGVSARTFEKGSATVSYCLILKPSTLALGCIWYAMKSIEVEHLLHSQLPSCRPRRRC